MVAVTMMVVETTVAMVVMASGVKHDHCDSIKGKGNECWATKGR
jgi:hypothetical protein